MAIYLCRWPNGDVSLAAGESEVEVADVLDEVDNPDAAELMQLDHAIAVHFKLGTRPGQEGTLPLRFENMSEQLESSIYERAYPVYDEVRTKPEATAKELTEALKHEKNPIYRRAPDPSSNPSVAHLQDELQMPRVVLEHLAGAMAVATVTSVNVKQAVPFFGVSNMESSLRFYVDGLGFKMKRWWIPDQADGQDDYKPDGRIRWCWLELGEAAIMLQVFLPERQPKEPLGSGLNVCFQCEDALALYREFKSRGIQTLKRPSVGNRLWVVPVTDPDGYRMEFSSPTDAPEDTELEE